MTLGEQILLIIVGAVLGIPLTFLGQLLWHKYIKREEMKNRTINIVVNRYAYGETVYLELANIGDDDIKELQVYIKWLQDGKSEDRILRRFFEPADNPITDSAKTIEYLSVSEKVRIADIPQRSDDGIIKVIINGMGVTSGRELDRVTELKVDTPIRIHAL